MKKVVILENIRSLHNVGSILRTADGAGWNKIYLCGYTGCPPDRRIEKVSLGAEEFLDWEKQASVLEVLQDLQKKKFEIIALEQTSQSKNLFEAEFLKKNIALIVGNEVEGVTPEVLSMCDRHLEIPMNGKKNSLNVSIAAGVAMYEIGRKTK
ncbi:RNA methyltransferase [Candidatus Gracilibacteria bacterium]|nr:RNA methyltransferase [Candidatus Gracilibacteria bacterium]